MEFDRIHFYVEDAPTLRDLFVGQLGFQAIASAANNNTCTEVVSNGNICFILSSPLTAASPVATWLKLHPPGVADIAFRVGNLESVMAQATTHGAKVLQPIQQKQDYLKFAKITGWGDLTHTLIEQKTPLTVGQLFTILGQSDSANDQALPFTTSIDRQSPIANHQLPITNYPSPITNYQLPITNSQALFTSIDHAVLNVETGDLELAVKWYQNTLGFQPQQNFEIQTKKSALRSRVMIHSSGSVQLPINEPASANSQIQEFLDANRGAGIQHIALQTNNILQVVTELRSRGLPFLPVPSTYYSELRQQSENYLSSAEWEAIEVCQVLVDWQKNISEAMLLQIFTQPIFKQPTLFFELIERRKAWVKGQQIQAQGFGEGNFRALFEAIEREQIKRGSLSKEGI
ncbi:VOC family protein [Kamptonema animale CS-326]|jgi:4-hydroxyphenylpyruvate dioxygenase|uniref:4-hydroxyphenylpyruvate dioxygenase family protein n=1 Tax=Kamptonema animale TaxID=92934 RepID=UPI00233110B6|nr:VOC family protein [Kamptonema animale]MDB9511808.1 VOC family protein [Kamptonema animale CS-326]